MSADTTTEPAATEQSAELTDDVSPGDDITEEDKAVLQQAVQDPNMRSEDWAAAMLKMTTAKNALERRVKEMEERENKARAEAEEATKKELHSTMAGVARIDPERKITEEAQKVIDKKIKEILDSNKPGIEMLKDYMGVLAVASDNGRRIIDNALKVNEAKERKNRLGGLDKFAKTSTLSLPRSSPKTSSSSSSSASQQAPPPQKPLGSTFTKNDVEASLSSFLISGGQSSHNPRDIYAKLQSSIGSDPGIERERKRMRM